MILLVNPQVCRPENRRFPLSVMAIGAALPDDVSWEIVDGNRPDVDELRDVVAHVEARAGGLDPVEAVAVSVMPGPQLVGAVPLTRRLKELYPRLPIVWGGYFPTLYPRPVLESGWVDWIVRGQGERTFAELVEVMRGRRDPRGVAGLGYVDGGVAWAADEAGAAGGDAIIGAERPWLGPDELPAPPYDRIPVDDYIHATFLGRRNAVYQASIGCPYGCTFCGVISMFGRREKVESPARTASHLRFLAERHGVDAIHFYDNNFFVKEAHALELSERIEPLALSWWCEARIDAMLRFSDATWRRLRRSGLKMVFFGAESGSNDVLRRMNKQLTIEQTLEIAARTREHGIVPEFSFVLGGPDDPAAEIETTLDFIRRLKNVNPEFELIAYFYTPTPQRGDAYGDVDPYSGTPTRLEDWTRPEWVRWMTHEDPDTPWLTPELKTKVEDFVLVLQSRFPSIHDRRTRTWGKAVARVLAAHPWQAGRYERSRLLRALRRVARIPRPGPLDYGHLRPSAEAIR